MSVCEILLVIVCGSCVFLNAVLTLINVKLYSEWVKYGILGGGKKS